MPVQKWNLNQLRPRPLAVGTDAAEGFPGDGVHGELGDGGGSDTGSGIPAEQWESIFNEFTQVDDSILWLPIRLTMPIVRCVAAS